jgi:hypothetical protein
MLFLHCVPDGYIGFLIHETYYPKIIFSLSLLNMSKYSYTAFGLCFTSEVELPELPGFSGDSCDIEIKTGTVPASLENPLKQTVRFSLAENDFLLTVDNIARYRVQNGNSITIEPAKNATIDEIRLFMYGSAFAALFHQRGMMPLHASTVYDPDGALAFAGNSGAGKSSLSFSLIETGLFKLVSDDITILNYKDGNITVQPGMPHVKLWADVLEHSQKDISQLKSIRKQIQKYRYPLETNFTAAPVLLKALFFLSSQHQQEIQILPITGAEKFNLLQNNIFRSQFITGKDLQEKYFKLTTAVLQKVPVFRIIRPRLGFGIERLREKVIESLQ